VVSEAQRAALRCDTKSIFGWKVAVKFQKPSYRQRTSFSIWLGGIGEGIRESDVMGFIKAESGHRPSSVSFGPLPFREKDGAALAREVLERHGQLETFEMQPATGNKRRALAKYAQPENAKQAMTRITGAIRNDNTTSCFQVELTLT